MNYGSPDAYAPSAAAPLGVHPHQAPPPPSEDLLQEAKRLLDQSKALSPTPVKNAEPDHQPATARGSAGAPITPAATTAPYVAAPVVNVDLSAPPQLQFQTKNANTPSGHHGHSFDQSLQYVDRQRLIFLIGQLSDQLSVEIQARGSIKQQAIAPMVQHIEHQDAELKFLRSENAALQVSAALALKEKEMLQQRVEAAEKIANDISVQRSNLNQELKTLVETVRVGPQPSAPNATVATSIGPSVAGSRSGSSVGAPSNLARPSGTTSAIGDSASMVARTPSAASAVSGTSQPQVFVVGGAGSRTGSSSHLMGGH